MNWTIEKVRQLPENNWLGIKRVGEHAWQIGDSNIPNQIVVHTGDGGVLEYIKAFENFDYSKIEYGTPGKVETISEENFYPNLTTEDLEKKIKEVFDGMD